MEVLGEKVLGGTSHEMTNAERYEFMKNREIVPISQNDAHLSAIDS